MDTPSKHEGNPDAPPAEAPTKAADNIHSTYSQVGGQPRVVVESQAANEFPSPEEHPTPFYELYPQKIVPLPDPYEFRQVLPVADPPYEFYRQVLPVADPPDEFYRKVFPVADAPSPIAFEEEEDLYSDNRITIKRSVSERPPGSPRPRFSSLPRAPVAKGNNADFCYDDANRSASKRAPRASRAKFSLPEREAVAAMDEEDLYSDDRITAKRSASEGAPTTRNKSSSPERVIQSMPPRKPRPTNPPWRREGRPKFPARLRELLFVKKAD